MERLKTRLSAAAHCRAGRPLLQTPVGRPALPRWL